jgi:hypothetical protein
MKPALTGLPPASAVFTGRDHPMHALQQALKARRPAESSWWRWVAGLAGIDKTELVLHTAHQALRDGWFPGGCCSSTYRHTRALRIWLQYLITEHPAYQQCL